MVRTQVKIKNKLGLHARAASMVVSLVRKYKCKVKFIKNNVDADASSIMELLLLEGDKGSEIEIVVDGEDEAKLLDELISLIANKFGED